MAKIYEEVVGRILKELDEQHANHQKTHRKFHGKEDNAAKHTYGLLVDLCERIRKEILSQERK